MFGIVACSSISVQDPDSPVSDLYLEKRAPMRFGKRFADPEGLELIRYVRAPMRYSISNCHINISVILFVVFLKRNLQIFFTKKFKKITKRT